MSRIDAVVKFEISPPRKLIESHRLQGYEEVVVHVAGQVAIGVDPNPLASGPRVLAFGQVLEGIHGSHLPRGWRSTPGIIIRLTDTSGSIRLLAIVWTFQLAGPLIGCSIRSSQARQSPWRIFLCASVRLLAVVATVPDGAGNLGSVA